MIPNYSDHAANERTFLAWVRTGIATIAFGFVIEKFYLLDRDITIARHISLTGGGKVEKISESTGRYDGPVLVFIGIVVIALAAIRFSRTGKLIESDKMRSVQTIQTELALSITLIIAALLAYVALK
jgi:putative membrane protein